MDMKHLTILGSTGSIGTSTLDLIAQYPHRFRVAGLSAYRDDKKLEEQIRKFRPRLVSLVDREAAGRLHGRCRDFPVEILSGIEGQNSVATMAEADMVVSAIVGSAGLLPTLAAIRAGKPVALANKETLVMAGQIVCKEARQRNVPILPVDSEHSAVFQAVEGRRLDHVRRIILTASGGPLLDINGNQYREIKPAQALQHPTWRMGAKISIDSATLMNKGLEVIEAHHLFNLPPEQIDVLIHRQSIVHSMVEFIDGSVMAQMGIPDMRIPLSYALNYPDRLPLDLPELDLIKVGLLSFEEPDLERFPCLGFAYQALSVGETMPAVLNAANEESVTAYLKEEIGFTDIAKVIRKTMDAHQISAAPTLDDILSADRWAREHAMQQVRALA
jgi:1-deoxy-D-xylulose-5-phosphate reductoisomerase